MLPMMNHRYGAYVLRKGRRRQHYYIVETLAYRERNDGTVQLLGIAFPTIGEPFTIERRYLTHYTGSMPRAKPRRWTEYSHE